VGAENYVTLCDLGILVDQTAQPVPAQNPDTCAFGEQIRARPAGGLWCGVGAVDAGCCDTRSHVVSELVEEVWLMPET
jgi:hypothetical protein